MRSGVAQKAGKIPSSGSAGEDPSATVQPFSSKQDAALPLSGMRVLLEASSARRAPRQAAHRTPEAPSGLSTTHGMDQATPAPAGAGRLPAFACATTRPLQLLWRARALSLAQPLLPWGAGLYVSMAQPVGRQAEQLDVGAVPPSPQRRQDSASAYDGSATSASVRLKAELCTAEASTTEEPDAGKLHVRVCTGGAG